MTDEQPLLLNLPDNDEEDAEHRLIQKPTRKKIVVRGRNPRYVNQGAANVMKEWPSHHSHTHYWLILATILFLIFFTFLYFTCFRKNPLGPIDAEKRKCLTEDFNGIKKLFKKIVSQSKNRYDATCKDFSDKDRALIELENSTESYSLISDCNIFYVHDDSTPFSHLKACALESALRYAPDKQFFLIRLTKCPSKAEQEDNEPEMHSLVYNSTAVLRNDYPNLKTVTTDGCKYFQGSPFQDMWQDGSGLANLAAQILTAWRFGGTVLSLNALVTNRKLFDQIESSVEVSKLFIRSRMQCNKFIQEMMLEMRKKMVPTSSSNNSSSATSKAPIGDLVNDVINKSLMNYCHNPLGCNGVRKTERSKICDKIEEQCFLLDFKRWRKENVDWKRSMHFFCPFITKRSLNFTV